MKSLLAATALTLVAGASFAQDAATQSIAEIVTGSADHTTLLAAVQAAGLAETLSGEGNFTVFAPTNAAFEALPAGTVDNLLLPESKDALTNVLLCHVVEDEVMSSELVEMIGSGENVARITTMGGCVLEAKMDGDAVTITDENGAVATVTAVDLDATNGVVHVTDAVFTPKM